MITGFQKYGLSPKKNITLQRYLGWPTSSTCREQWDRRGQVSSFGVLSYLPGCEGEHLCLTLSCPNPTLDGMAPSHSHPGLTSKLTT